DAGRGSAARDDHPALTVDIPAPRPLRLRRGRRARDLPAVGCAGRLVRRPRGRRPRAHQRCSGEPRRHRPRRRRGALMPTPDWRRLRDERDEARHVADEQLAAWTRLASRVGDRERVLAVSHGGIIELPALVLAERLRAPLAGAAFGYCEGVRVEYAKGAATKIAVLRL